MARDHAVDYYRREMRTPEPVDVYEHFKNKPCHPSALIWASPVMSPEDIIWLEPIHTLPDKERVYAITKGYLKTGLERLEQHFKQLYDSLTPAKKELLREAKYPESDHSIFRIFYGIDSGLHARSAGMIKRRVRKHIAKARKI